MSAWKRSFMLLFQRHYDGEAELKLHLHGDGFTDSKLLHICLNLAMNKQWQCPSGVCKYYSVLMKRLRKQEVWKPLHVHPSAPRLPTLLTPVPQEWVSAQVTPGDILRATVLPTTLWFPLPFPVGASLPLISSSYPKMWIMWLLVFKHPHCSRGELRCGFCQRKHSN